MKKQSVVKQSTPTSPTQKLIRESATWENVPGFSVSFGFVSGMWCEAVGYKDGKLHLLEAAGISGELKPITPKEAAGWLAEAWEVSDRISSEFMDSDGAARSQLFRDLASAIEED